MDILIVFDADAKFSLFFNFNDQLCIEYSKGDTIESARLMSLNNRVRSLKCVSHNGIFQIYNRSLQ